MKTLLKRIPRVGWIAGMVYFVLQYSLYRLADWLSRVLGTIDNAWCPKIPAIDDKIPVIAAFALVYLFSYAFWIGGPIAASVTKKENFINYLIGLSAAYLIGFFIFLFSPTYMDRSAEGLMEIASEPGAFSFLLQMIYSNDGSTMAFNLFPSYHCLISLYCYLGIRKQPEVSMGFRVYSLGMTVLICLSTVFTKQHYFLDILGGLGISLLCYTVVSRLNPAAQLLRKRAERLL